jgi:hypothetical protein
LFETLLKFLFACKVVHDHLLWKGMGGYPYPLASSPSRGKGKMSEIWVFG